MADYTELVKRLRHCSKEYGGCGTCELSDTCVLQTRILLQAADAIEELQQTAEHYKGCADDWYEEACDYKAMLPRWIPATERLPEQNTRVIGFMAWKGITAIEYQNGKWYSIDHLQSLPDEAVTHWMPLPPPPKEV